MSPEAREHSFDELTRGLANGTLSRGKALRLLGAALTGGALASVSGIAWAKPKPGKCNKDKHCPPGHVCVDRMCQGGGGCPSGTTLISDGTCCPNSQVCATGAGVTCCPSNQGCCNGICTDLSNDLQNCGTCGNVCPLDPGGGGSSGCCGGVCVNLGYDEQNCSVCGNVCPGDQGCIRGQCTCGLFGGPYELCNGRCTNINGSDPNNCGGCGIVCPPGTQCIAPFGICREVPG
jgi:hypothetical protein